MSLLKIVILGLVIGANNLAAALALGALSHPPRRAKVILVFGVFEFAVPLLGLELGRMAARWVATHAAWLGAALLVGLGVWVIVMGLSKPGGDERLAQLTTTWHGLGLLAAGLSVDNLVIGFSLGLRETEPLLLAAVIATCSVAFAWAGMRLGKASRRYWEQRAEVGAGVLLLGLGAASAMGWL